MSHFGCGWPSSWSPSQHWPGRRGAAGSGVHERRRHLGVPHPRAGGRQRRVHRAAERRARRPSTSPAGCSRDAPPASWRRFEPRNGGRRCRARPGPVVPLCEQRRRRLLRLRRAGSELRHRHHDFAAANLAASGSSTARPSWTASARRTAPAAKAPVPDAGQPDTADNSFERVGGTQDTDNNVADFTGPKPGNPQRFGATGTDAAPTVTDTDPNSIRWTCRRTRTSRSRSASPSRRAPRRSRSRATSAARTRSPERRTDDLHARPRHRFAG